MEALDKLIIESYQAAVALDTQTPMELKAALKTHERVPSFITRLKKEILTLPAKLATRENIAMVVTDLTIHFLFQLREHIKQKEMSEAQKNLILRNVEKSKILNKAVDTGIIDDEVMDVLSEEGKK